LRDISDGRQEAKTNVGTEGWLNRFMEPEMAGPCGVRSILRAETRFPLGPNAINNLTVDQLTS